MDRRRFSPSAEGLEGRALLSLLGATPKSNATVSVQDLPRTYKEKELRIAHLPYYLQQEDPRRFLPADLMEQLQTDINAVVAKLHAPTPGPVNAFNAGLRRLMPTNNLSPAEARYVNHSFGAVLEHSGATPAQVANLQYDMNQLARVDAASIQPTTLARNDYSLVLQTTLAVGRPMITPTAPTLLATDGRKIEGGRVGLTHSHNPTMVGEYQAGATNDGSVSIQIVDQSGRVLGTAPVSASGTYAIPLTTIPDGVYLLRARSSDEVGHLSEESNPFTLYVKTAPVRQITASVPGGPLALSN